MDRTGLLSPQMPRPRRHAVQARASRSPRAMRRRGRARQSPCARSVASTPSLPCKGSRILWSGAAVRSSKVGGRYIAFNGQLANELATQLLSIAERQTAVVPLMLGHRLMGTSLLWMGAISEGRVHLDRAASMYSPAEHRPLAVRFGADIGVLILSHRSMALWQLGYPDLALADTEAALKDARDLGQAATLMNALATASHSIFQSGNHWAAKLLFDELVVLAEDKDSLAWKPTGKALQGFVLAEMASILKQSKQSHLRWRRTG
jgi:hypothetical protein